MSTNTSRFSLVKPVPTDPFLTSDFQSNYDKIDAAIPTGTLGYALSGTANDITSSGGAYALIARVNVVVPPGARRIMVVGNGSHCDAAIGICTFRLVRGGALIKEWPVGGKTGAPFENSFGNPSFTFIDSPNAGAQVYEWYFVGNNGQAGSLRQTRGQGPDPTHRASLWVGEV